jgi:mono/diheme cytochrome c family protein
MKAIALTALAGLTFCLIKACAGAAEPAEPLAFDATLKECEATNGQPQAHFTFAVTNVSSSDVVITQVFTSCGCTVASLPSQPWRLTPNSGGVISATLNIFGNVGAVVKTLTIVSSAGNKTLTIKVNVPAPPPQDPQMLARARNQEVAKADRQAVLRNDCARCHLAPAYGKTGRELYVAVCGVCHEAKQRATMVTDLRTANRANDPEIWRSFIEHGKVASFMPGFGQADGGPLDDRQVNSLLAYLASDYRHDVFTVASVSSMPQSPPRVAAPPPPTSRVVNRQLPPPRTPFVTPAARELLAKPPPSPTDPNAPEYSDPEEKK